MSQPLLNITPPHSPYAQRDAGAGQNRSGGFSSDIPILTPQGSPVLERLKSVVDREARLSDEEYDMEAPTTHRLKVNWREKPMTTISSAINSNTGDTQENEGSSVAITISKLELDSATGYAICRGEGLFTRLIPADWLPPIDGLSTTLRSSHGLIVLPVPGQKESKDHYQVCTCPRGAVLRQH